MASDALLAGRKVRNMPFIVGIRYVLRQIRTAADDDNTAVKQYEQMLYTERGSAEDDFRTTMEQYWTNMNESYGQNGMRLRIVCLSMHRFMFWCVSCLCLQKQHKKVKTGR